ncbi:MAG TPA: hypothetical protein VF461_24895 [Gemmatimonadaceae bacterium]
MRRFSVSLAVVAIAVACHGGGDAAKSDPARVQQQAVVTDATQADSARSFVQGFYDWYLATQSHQGYAYDSLLTVRRALLGDSLFKNFSADVAAQHADSTQIASLSAEGDIFLNSQDPCEYYTARPASTSGAGAFAVIVAGNCEGLDAKPNIEVYVRHTATGWQIEDIKDPTQPEYDLLSALVRYHATEPSDR